ncbi:LOW QUALITY PROTEIN: ribosome biogenesis protein brix, putative [Eimeria mitis]|uniref:Ribosome biogenesis protein brix, putative n=1 Tax=Eimeria mitis TaxID=44415 RepID=U6KGY8_9EIME|nr:LOW QUALITY PROTEIN: ribosome biogenesis protein brix, putative [Eimeria mitis]CDJ35517.1 ribosome biogenesis protein brix, putative [Eimeria mitis]
MGRKETVTAPAGVATAGTDATTLAGRASNGAASKRAAADATPGRDDGAAQGMLTEQLKQRKKPRLQHRKEQLQLHLTRTRPEQKQEQYQQKTKLQQHGQPAQKPQLNRQLMKKQEQRQSRHYKRQELLMDECGEDRSVTDDDFSAERAEIPEVGAAADPPASAASDSALTGTATLDGAAEGDRAAAIDAAAAADPYLLEDADYLRRETRWLNRQRVLLLGSRGISARSRHLIEDFKKLLPHHKSEASIDPKRSFPLTFVAFSLARSVGEAGTKLLSFPGTGCLSRCNSVVYLEQRKNDALLHVVKVPLGPTFIARLMNVETLNEVRLSGNCLLHSRPLLIFGAEFDKEPHFRVLKELFMQVFGTPRNHPKSKPFFDHAMSFFVTDNRIWFRHYQIAPLVMGEGGDANNPHRQTFIEIGPRFVLDPVKILEGSFCGKTLWRNGEFVRTRDVIAETAATSGSFGLRKAAGTKGKAKGTSVNT